MELIPRAEVSEKCRRARQRIRIRGYRKAFLADLPLSLTLGGVLCSIALAGLPQSAWTWLTGMLLVGVAVLAVPYLRLRAATNEEKVLLVRVCARRLPQDAFYHQLFHVTKIFQQAADIANEVTQVAEEQSPNAERILATLGEIDRRSIVLSRVDYVLTLADQIYDLFELESSADLLNYMRCEPRYLQSAVKRFLSRTRTWANLLGSNVKEKSVAREKMEATHQQISALTQRFVKLVGTTGHPVDPSLSWEGFGVTKASGTGAAVLTLIDLLRNRHTSTSDGESAQTLLSLVDNARGYPLSELGDLTEWRSDSSKPIPSDVLARIEAVDKVAQRFRARVLSFVKTELCERTEDSPRLLLATSGYSNVVLQCIKESREYVGRVYIVAVNSSRNDESLEMEQALRHGGVDAYTIESTLFMRESFKKTIDLAVFGFEAMSFQGDLCHPRGLAAVVDAVSRDPQPAHGVLAVGESWKIRDFPVRISDPHFVAAFGCLGFSSVITDCEERHDVAHGSADLRCCSRHWQKVRAASLALKTK